MKIERLKRGEKKIINDILKIFETLYIKPKLATKDKRNINISRSNIYKNPPKKGIKAFVLGKVTAYHTAEKVLSRASRLKRNKPLWILLKKLIRLHNPKFKYSSIQINKSVKTGWHKDRKNYGDSYCLGIGNFTGGGIDVKINNKISNIDNKNKWLVYDGSDIEHRTAKFKGERIAIIYYNIEKKK